MKESGLCVKKGDAKVCLFAVEVTEMRNLTSWKDYYDMCRQMNIIIYKNEDKFLCVKTKTNSFIFKAYIFLCHCL